jgi:hypothetical protein
MIFGRNIMLKIFEPIDLIGFDDVEGVLAKIDVVAAGKIHKDAGPCVSVVKDGIVVLAIGLDLSVGEAEAWLTLRKGCASPSVFKEARDWFNQTCIDYKLYKVKVIIRRDDYKFAATARFFGFSNQEGVWMKMIRL